MPYKLKDLIEELDNIPDNERECWFCGKVWLEGEKPCDCKKEGEK